MSKGFTYWKKQHDSNSLDEFNSDIAGLLWLKVKSITRKGIIDEFISRYSYEIEATTLNSQFKELFNKLSETVDTSHEQLKSLEDN